jgi:dihydrodipicolinate reductase
LRDRRAGGTDAQGFEPRTFANGALRAALGGETKPGLYDMQDVLGLK